MFHTAFAYFPCPQLHLVEVIIWRMIVIPWVHQIPLSFKIPHICFFDLQFSLLTRPLDASSYTFMLAHYLFLLDILYNQWIICKCYLECDFNLLMLLLIYMSKFLLFTLYRQRHVYDRLKLLLLDIFASLVQGVAKTSFLLSLNHSEVI